MSDQVLTASEAHYVPILRAAPSSSRSPQGVVLQLPPGPQYGAAAQLGDGQYVDIASTKLPDSSCSQQWTLTIQLQVGSIGRFLGGGRLHVFHWPVSMSLSLSPIPHPPDSSLGLLFHRWIDPPSRCHVARTGRCNVSSTGGLDLRDPLHPTATRGGGLRFQRQHHSACWMGRVLEKCGYH